MPLWIRRIWVSIRSSRRISASFPDSMFAFSTSNLRFSLPGVPRRLLRLGSRSAVRTSATFSSRRLCAAEGFLRLLLASALPRSLLDVRLRLGLGTGERPVADPAIAGATNELSPTRLSMEFRKMVTLSKFRFPGPSFRISKNCSETKSTSAMKIVWSPGLASSAFPLRRLRRRLP
jgi:hypothetical protein